MLWTPDGQLLVLGDECLLLKLPFHGFAHFS